ncbi:uncharacterized protein RCC_02983 [Ramularia collo-cygni]|uniref:BZIP domain-containing protein n=1 Tax=Ramularia collo-cygni TaxID=112498 RepID=A0A2D3UPC0_9PEZI|nr:uncharacterized protein RCC_02983 [Ramularia collo-cygni]CZT17151.1 uncharacterized protein RCC_02983 [Ramularia collo-cygni]
MGDSSITGGDMAAPSKIESLPEGTPSSIESTPEPEPGAEPSNEPVQPQKRKGGRKPIYATSEERKQRNRQAQAAFRERRTEYIKQLEATIKQNEDQLATLQQNHRTAADECLMLRYKNSLLERILLEKGIDVQAELQMKSASPVLGPGFMTHGVGLPHVQQPPLQRTALHRQQARRSATQPFLPKLAPGQTSVDMAYAQSSPLAHPTPSSHTSSPSAVSTRSPMAVHQAGMPSPAPVPVTQPQAQHFANFTRPSQQQSNQALYQAQQQQVGAQRQAQRSATNYHSSGMSSASAGSHHSANHPGQGGNPATTGPLASTFYPSPFQKHFDQLDQEYDTQQTRSMLDEPDVEDLGAPHSPVLHGTYPPQFEHSQGQQHPNFYPQARGGMATAQSRQTPPHTQYDQPQMIHPTSHPTAAEGHFDVDQNDAMLDTDPFNMGPNLHYPNAYTYDQHQQR